MHRRVNVTGERLAEQIHYHLALVRATARHNEFVDLRLATDLHNRLIAALQDFDSLDDNQRGTLVAAVAYFVRTDDEEDDLRSPIGFDDDAEVINRALSRISRSQG